MSLGENKNTNENVSTDNIFDELSGDIENSNFADFNPEENKLKRYSKLSGMLASFLVFVLVISGAYIFFQKSSNDFVFLGPICNILVGIENDTHCFGVEKELKDNTRLLETTTLSYADKISGILSKAYSLDSFIKSREVVFLLERGEFRLKPFEIISQFDKEKNAFLSLNKRLIQCSNVRIDSNLIMDIDCDVYSSSWNKWDNNTKQGSSVSIASSFQNYFQSSDNFTLLDPQKRFDVVNITGGVFSQMTPLHLRLKYSPSDMINIK